MSALFLYTSCTQTKTLPVPECLHLGKLEAGTLLGRQSEWQSRLDEWIGNRRGAKELYCGGHWSVVRQLANSNLGLRCFVISGGYGLIETSATIAPYAATFAFRHSDSISHSGGDTAPKENIAWWNGLCQWHPQGVEGPRSLREAISEFPESVHLFAMSPFYLDAISEDLSAARQELSDSNRLIVISTGKKRHGVLNGNVISAPARLQSALGGALVSLNVRLAAELVNAIPLKDFTLNETRRFVDDLAGRAGPRVYPVREPASDDEVIRFIKMERAGSPKASYTSILRAFRSSGRACEMKRFKGLFERTLLK